MTTCRILCLLVTSILVTPPAVARGGARIPIPKGITAELALELFKSVGDYAGTLQTRFQRDGVQVTIHPPGKTSLSFTVPIQVRLTRSEEETVLGFAVPYSRIQVTVDVRCSCVVSYDLSRVHVEGTYLVLPEATVIPAYEEPPGERGDWSSDASLFRLRNSPSIEALRRKLMEEALHEAKRLYFHAKHARLEGEMTAKLTTELATLAIPHLPTPRENNQTQRVVAKEPMNWTWTWGGVAGFALLVAVGCYVSRNGRS